MGVKGGSEEPLVAEQPRSPAKLPAELGGSVGCGGASNAASAGQCGQLRTR